MPKTLLATPEDVYEMLDAFNPSSTEIAAFFRDHDVDPTGVVKYAELMANGATSMPVASDREAFTLMISLFTSGVALGLRLADANRTPKLRLVPAE